MPGVGRILAIHVSKELRRVLAQLVKVARIVTLAHFGHASVHVVAQLLGRECGDRANVEARSVTVLGFRGLHTPIRVPVAASSASPSAVTHSLILPSNNHLHLTRVPLRYTLEGEV